MSIKIVRQNFMKFDKPIIKFILKSESSRIIHTVLKKVTIRCVLPDSICNTNWGKQTNRADYRAQKQTCAQTSLGISGVAL